jgi:hypothetical protein
MVQERQITTIYNIQRFGTVVVLVYCKWGSAHRIRALQLPAATQSNFIFRSFLDDFSVKIWPKKPSRSSSCQIYGASMNWSTLCNMKNHQWAWTSNSLWSNKGSRRWFRVIGNIEHFRRGCPQPFFGRSSHCASVFGRSGPIGPVLLKCSNLSKKQWPRGIVTELPMGLCTCRA